jgi:DNA gyrase subunit A
MSFEENNENVSIEKEISSSFLEYSMSVIVSRALPDVRDGLKPVHRRILYGMSELKNYFNKPYLKSARIVGDVMGKYHPHGDSAIYDALVRMAQSFSLRHPLVDGQGNFGSIDGDSAAAMRYTESRMRELCNYLLEDLDKDTVDFVPNYDNKDLEPSVLPAQFPQLLVNGASGIAVGMATNIPPHNLGEVLDAVLAYIENPEITVLELMAYIKAPDFPTGAEIHGTKGIFEAYSTGRGSLMMRAKAGIEERGGRQYVVVTELPFQVNKARLIERIADLVRDKKIEGISDIRDESKDDIRIVIQVKKGENGEVLLNNLYKQTQLQCSFGMNFVAIVRGEPKQLSLKSFIKEFYSHRREVILRRTTFLLRKAQEKAHLLLGLKIAVEHADSVVDLIRKASDTNEAREQLIARFALSDVQARAILDMKLARLTGLEREKIVKEHEEILIEIADLEDILRVSARVTNLIIEEIKLLKEKFAERRLTEVFASDADDFTSESLIDDEEVAVTVTEKGYVKRTAMAEIVAQKRGGKGKSGMLTKDEDFVQNVFMTTNHKSLLCFTNSGRVYNLKVYQIPEAALRSKGKHFANLISLEKDERVVSVLSVPEFIEESFVVSVTKKGFIKKTDLMAYSNVRTNGIIGLKLDDGDSLITCKLCSEGEDLFMATHLGKAIRFSEEEVRPVGRASRGVRGIRFSSKTDFVVGLEVLSKAGEGTILSVCEKGYGKRTPLSEYRKQSRGGKGIYTIKVTERNGGVVGIAQVQEQDHVMVMTSQGKLVRFAVKDLGIIGRMTQGVRLISVSEGEKLISLGKVAVDEVQGEEVAIQEIQSVEES